MANQEASISARQNPVYPDIDIEKKLETQVLIIGAGITGASIARELSQYKVDVTVVEKSPDAFIGQTKAGHGLVYSGRSLVMAFSIFFNQGNVHVI